MRAAVSKNLLRWGIPILAVMLCVLVAVRLSEIEKTELVNRSGQTFETGVVTDILQDNLQENGQRVGQQTVVVHMTSGEREGQDLTTTSSAGYLFGAVCTEGMRVVVLQSVAGESTIIRLRVQNHKQG